MSSQTDKLDRALTVRENLYYPGFFLDERRGEPPIIFAGRRTKNHQL